MQISYLRRQDFVTYNSCRITIKQIFTGRLGFLNFSTLDILGQIIICCEEQVLCIVGGLAESLACAHEDASSISSTYEIQGFTKCHL